jgi:hypothetical protein
MGLAHAPGNAGLRRRFCRLGAVLRARSLRRTGGAFARKSFSAGNPQPRRARERGTPAAPAVSAAAVESPAGRPRVRGPRFGPIDLFAFESSAFRSPSAVSAATVESPAAEPPVRLVWGGAASSPWPSFGSYMGDGTAGGGALRQPPRGHGRGGAFAPPAVSRRHGARAGRRSAVPGGLREGSGAAATTGPSRRLGDSARDAEGRLRGGTEGAVGDARLGARRRPLATRSGNTARAGAGGPGFQLETIATRPARAAAQEAAARRGRAAAAAPRPPTGRGAGNALPPVPDYPQRRLWPHRGPRGRLSQG